MIIKVSNIGGTNYTDVPEGEIDLTEIWIDAPSDYDYLDAFLSKHMLEIISKNEDGTITVETEWGNGEGVDTFEIAIVANSQETLHAVMTAAEVGEVYGFAEATVRQAINRGQIPARKSGGVWLVAKSDVVAKWGTSN